MSFACAAKTNIHSHQLLLRYVSNDYACGYTIKSSNKQLCAAAKSTATSVLLLAMTPQNPTCVLSTGLLRSYQTTGLPLAADMQAQYMEIARALDPHVDMFLAETLSTAAEAQAAAAAAAAIAPGEPLKALGT
jgi:hypothetical protein